MDDEITLQMGDLLLDKGRRKKTLNVDGDLFALGRRDTARLGRALIKISKQWPEIANGETRTVSVGDR